VKQTYTVRIVPKGSAESARRGKRGRWSGLWEEVLQRLPQMGGEDEIEIKFSDEKEGLAALNALNYYTRTYDHLDLKVKTVRNEGTRNVYVFRAERNGAPANGE